jgi:5'-3' exonuclease
MNTKTALGKDHILLIDANSFGYASMYQPNLAKLSHNGWSTSALVGLPASVFSIIKRYPDALPVLLWDGHATWRYDLYPEYKANRSGDPVKAAIKADYHRQSDVLRLLFADIGIPQIRCPDSEADDLAGHLCRFMSDRAEITLLTNDTDWLQAVSPSVTWESRDGRRVSLSNFTDATQKEGGMSSPSEYILCKAIAGDVADNICGIEGIGTKKAKTALDQFGSLDRLCHAVSSGDKGASGKGIRSIAAGMDTIHRNLSLMDWQFSPPVNPYTTMMVAKMENSDLYKEYGLDSIKRHKDNFDQAALSPSALNLVEWALYCATLPRDREGE